MFRSFVRRQSPTARVGAWLLLWVTAALLPGCASFGGVFSPWHRPEPCVLPPDAPLSHVVGHINAQVSQLRSWRSTDVKIVARGAGALPIRLNAKVAVEHPKKFRLTVSALGSQQADLGSNPERFWFWMRDSKPRHVFTARHSEIAKVQQLPFQPEWVIEALGVVPIDEAGLVVQGQATEGSLLSLVSERVAPDGRPVRRVTLVDSCRGLIVAHELYDWSNRLVARAELNDYRRESEHGFMLPHEIHLDWPQAGLALTMHIGQIEINPEGIPLATWTMPQHRGYSPLDLAALPNVPLNEAQGRRRTDADRPGRVNLGAGAGNGNRYAAAEAAPWAPPTVRDESNPRRAGEPERWAPPFADPRRRRNWWQRLFGR